MEIAKISDAITRLRQIQEEHGDLPVFCAEIDGGGYGEIELKRLNEIVSFQPAIPPFWVSRKEDYPERVDISL